MTGGIFSGAFGENAEAEVEIAGFIRRYDCDRTMLFRKLIRGNVSRASPLLVAYAAEQGVDLADCVDHFAPPSGWPERRFPDHTLSFEPMMRKNLTKRLFGGLGEDQAFQSRMLRGGVVIRPPSDPNGRFGIRPSDGWLEACFDLGPVRLIVGSRDGRMLLPPGIPETILQGMVGRKLRDIVGHQLFDDDRLIVKRIGRPFRSIGASVAIFEDGEAAIDLSGGASS